MADFSNLFKGNIEALKKDIYDYEEKYAQEMFRKDLSNERIIELFEVLKYIAKKHSSMINFIIHKPSALVKLMDKPPNKENTILLYSICRSVVLN
jgi:hypothetical protein